MDRSTAGSTPHPEMPGTSPAARALHQLLERRPPVLLDLRASCRRAYHVEVAVSAALTLAGLVFGFLLLLTALQPAPTASELRPFMLMAGGLFGALAAVYATWRRCRPSSGTNPRDTLEAREIDIVRGVFRINVYDRRTLERRSSCEIGFDRLLALCEVDQRPRLLPWPRHPMARLTLVERGTGLAGPRRAPLWAIHACPAERAAPRRKARATTSAWDTARTAWVPPADMHEVIQVFAACTGLHVRHAAIEPDTSASTETLSISH